MENPRPKDPDILPEISKPFNDKTTVNLYRDISNRISPDYDMITQFFSRQKPIWKWEPEHPINLPFYVKKDIPTTILRKREEFQPPHTLVIIGPRVTQKVTVTTHRKFLRWEILRHIIKYTFSSDKDEDIQISQKVLHQINELLTKEYDWDSIDYEKPNPKDIDYAKRIMSNFMSSISSAGYTLEIPTISNCEDGGATMRWRKNERSLYFDISRQLTEATKIWKDDGKPLSMTEELCPDNYVEIWKWLIDE